MIIIVGLGNPGEKFNNTPHNLGFLVLDKFREKNNFPGFKLSKKLDSLISEEIFNGEKIILAKPQTFMNESGKAVKKIIANHKTQDTNLIVIHDDIDLSLETIKIIKNRGSAGHKGVESIIKEIGNNDFIRIRIGVTAKKWKALSVGRQAEKLESFVLKRFNKEEKLIVDNIAQKATDIIYSLVKNGLEKTMNRYNN